VTTQSFNS